jgi:hypothetical protein
MRSLQTRAFQFGLGEHGTSGENSAPQHRSLALFGKLQSTRFDRVIPWLAGDTGYFLRYCGCIGACTMKYAHLP